MSSTHIFKPGPLTPLQRSVSDSPLPICLIIKLDREWGRCHLNYTRDQISHISSSLLLNVILPLPIVAVATLIQQADIGATFAKLKKIAFEDLLVAWLINIIVDTN